MKKKTKDLRANIRQSEDTLYLEGEIDKLTVPALHKIFFRTKDLQGIKIVDLSRIKSLDSSGTIFIEEVAETIKRANRLQVPLQQIIKNYSEDTGNLLQIFSQASVKEVSPKRKETFFENVGGKVLSFSKAFFESMVLSADIFYWSLAAMWRRKGARKGSFIQQSLLIGMEAIPIVGLLSFIVGLIIALQAAAQLRMFGADIFIADMIGYAMLTEMGSLMTAIIVSGRSGSAIASEIATMKVTEELDALKMMSINPLRYVIVPKLHAITACMPLLVIFSIIVGILGGTIVAIFYLNMSLTAFYNQLVNVLTFQDFIITMIKSTFFGWAIVIIGSFYGLRVTGGAEGVGKATTYSVVTSIFAVIVIDVIFSLLYLP